MIGENVQALEVCAQLMKTHTVRYIVIKTKCTTHHIERLSATCRDRGMWKWIAETNPDVFDDPGARHEARNSHVDANDFFPRLYFLHGSVINEIGAWLGARNLKIINIEAPKI